MEADSDSVTAKQKGIPVEDALLRISDYRCDLLLQ